MPKRPCTITFTPDQKTILCGDKFGDVYALPLLPGGFKENHVLPPHEEPKTKQNPLSREAKFASSANPKTVHTLKNRKALEHQLSSANKKSSQKTMGFEHQLLLGHVSLLTDIVCVSVPGKDVARPDDRTYIITADRDEHIRVSRGMPQAHIIEGFCLGHTQFVSKLCVPRWNQQCLISGGGDDYLLVWNWLSGRILRTADLLTLVLDHIDQRYALSDLLGHDPIDHDTAQAQHAKIAVSELHAIETETAVGEFHRYITLAVEGMPAVFIFSIAEDGALQREVVFSTEGNVIGVTVSKDQNCIAYAMDTDHKSFSRTQVADKCSQKQRPSIGFLNFSTAKGMWKKNMELQNAFASVMRDLPEDDEQVMDGKESGNRGPGSLLYGLENLRKRGQDE
ncbi:MAG: hypothetical protein Q9225_000416 [Loekoesia sp. 1 TL-2023]